MAEPRVRVFTDEQVISAIAYLINNITEAAHLGNIEEAHRAAAKSALVAVMLVLGIPVVWDPSTEGAALAIRNDDGTYTTEPDAPQEPKPLDEGPAH